MAKTGNIGTVPVLARLGGCSLAPRRNTVGTFWTRIRGGLSKSTVPSRFRAQNLRFHSSGGDLPYEDLANLRRVKSPYEYEEFVREYHEFFV